MDPETCRYRVLSVVLNAWWSMKVDQWIGAPLAVQFRSSDSDKSKATIELLRLHILFIYVR